MSSTQIVIAAFNEAAVIGRVVALLRAAGWNVVVIDDGSRDATGRQAEAAGATVLRHPVNLGQGAALRTAFAFVLSRTDAEFIVTYDADGQHTPEQVPPMLEPLRDGSAEVTLGSRFLRKADAAGIPASRRLLLKAATALARRTTGLALTDTHNGLRGFTRSALQRMVLQQDRMAHASEIQHEIARLRLRYVEVPVRVSYTEYSLAKGQRFLSAVSVLWDLVIAKLR
jgi:glycosyltransferase involved in cell wall biosynthesis